MRTRTFIGLALLILLLVIAGSPSLLQAIATGAHLGMQQAGVVDDPGAPEPDSKATKEPAKPTLVLRGYSADGADLVDTVSAEQRTGNGYRLTAGAARRSLQGGSQADHETTLPVPPKSDGRVLDSNHCPVIERSDAAGRADAADDKLRRAMAAGADDVAACDASLLAASDAKRSDDPWLVNDRMMAASDRGGTLATYAALETQLQMLSLFSPDVIDVVRSAMNDELAADGTASQASGTAPKANG